MGNCTQSGIRQPLGDGWKMDSLTTLTNQKMTDLLCIQHVRADVNATENAPALSQKFVTHSEMMAY